MIGKTFSVTDNSQTIDLTVGSSYTFSNGDKLLLNYSDSTRDQLTAVLAYYPQITIAVTDADAGEPANNGTYRISRTGDTTNALTVNFSPGGTATSGSDYTLKNGSTALTNSVVIAAGQSYVDVTLAVIDDVIAEGPETAVMNLTADAAYTLGAGTSGTINIEEDDKFTSIVSSMTVTGETVSSGTQSIVDGGITNNTTINSGGTQWASSGGLASNTTINAGGFQYVANIVYLSSGYLGSGLSSGGVASNTIINSGGYQYVCGAASQSDVGSGGVLMVGSGGRAIGFTVASGGIFGWSFNAVISGSSNGVAVASSSGKTSYNLYLNSIMEQQNVSSGYISDHTTINSSIQSISSGGLADNTTINSGGVQFISGGTATNTTINSGGQHVSARGIAKSTTIYSGGLQDVWSGSVASNTVINGGGQFISFGGAVSNTTINSGTQFVSFGGMASNTIINSAGVQNVRGGAASNTTINLHGVQAIVSGLASYTTINSGGRQIVYNSGLASSTTINFGGSQLVSSLVSNTTINSGGLQYVGVFIMGGSSSIGETRDTVVNFGGSMYVSSGGIVDGTLTIAGGHLTLEYSDNLTASSIVFMLASAQTDDTLLTINSGVVGDISHTAFTLDVNNIATGSYILSSGSNLTGMSSAVFTVIDDGQSVSVQVGSSYTFADGDNLSLSFTDAATDKLTATFTIETVPPSIPSGLNRTITGNSAALDWNDSTDTGSGVKQYEIMVDNNADFSSPEYSASPVASGTTVNSLADGVYYWEVRSQDNAGNYSDWTSGSSFTVDITSPSVPATLTRTVTGSSVALDWADASDTMSGVKQYEFQIDNNSDFSSNEKAGTTVASETNATALADGNYYWRVRTQDNTGNYSDWTSGNNFTVDITAPSVPATLTRTVTGSSVALDWADAADATSGVKQYQVQIDDNGDFSSPVNTLTPAISAATATGLTDGTYFWKVRTLDNSGNYSTWTSGSSFTVDITAPSAPATLTRTVTGSSVALDWADAADATSGVKQYEFQIDNNSDFLSNEKSGIAVSSNATATGLGDGTYFWKVRTQDNTGNYSAWSSGSSFTVDITSPSVPATLTRTVTGSSVALGWEDATDATSGVKQYEFQVDNNSDFSSNEKSGTAVSSDANATGLSDGNYFWRVRTLDNSGNYSDWSSGSNFTVDITAPSSPSGLTPAVTGSSVALDWADATDATSGVKQYQVIVDNNADFSSPEYSASPLTSDATATGLTDGTYFWKVRTLDNSGNYSDWNAGSSFTIDTTAPSVPATLTRTVTGNSAVLDWADATDATSGVKQYEVQLDKHADFSSPEYSLSPAASTASINSLTDGIFYWRVRTQDNSGNASVWTSGSSFGSDVGGTIGGALLLSSPSTTGRVGTGDAADYYKITMTNAGTLTLGLTGLTGNADLTLLDSKLQLKVSSNPGTSNESIVQMLLAGDYYVKVAPGFGVKDAAYTLNHTEKYYPLDTAANTWLAAKDISGGVDNWVGFGDAADVYKITMTNAGTLTLGLTGLTGNADMSLLNSAGTFLKSSANIGNTSEAISNVALVAGTYYVKVTAGYGVNDASYKLTHTEKYTPADKAANDYKTALDISNLDNWVGFGDVADFYKLTMTNAGSLSLGLTGLTGNSDLSLLNSAGTVLKSSTKTGTADESISNVLLLAGTYYVKVAAGYGVNDANYTLTHTEKYTPSDTGANTWQAALNIDSGVDTWVGFGDTADYYKLTMANAGMLTLGLTGLTGNADLSLLNSAGTAIKTSANTGITNEAINNVALLAGTYYVKVAAGYGVNDASYTLSHLEKYTPTDKAANGYKTAQDIANLDNWVGFGDAADFYKLTMTNAGTLTLGLTGLTGNADLSLLNSAGTSLKTSANVGLNNEAINNVALLAGTYYVKVAAGTGVNDANYNLSNTIKYTPADKAANDYKTAQDISSLDNWVGFGDTADFYKLTMTNAGTLSLNLTGLTGNADLSLLNSVGTAIKTSANTGITSEAINGVSLLSGTYYVKVAAGYGVNDASYNLSNTVSYFPGDTSDQAGNTIATAKLIDVPTQTGWVGFGDTDDYYRFDLATAAIGTLRLHDMTGGNADLTLYNAKGIQLKKSASLGALEDTLTSTLAAGTYYARVNAVSGNIDYKLDFSKKDGYGMLAS